MIGRRTIRQSRRGLADGRLSAAAAFNPHKLPGLFLDLDADIGVTTISGAASVWADQSGAGNSVTQGTAGSRPTYNNSDATFHNHASLQSDGTKFMTLSALTSAKASPITIFIVYSASAATNAWFQDNDVTGGRTGITTSGTNIQGFSGSFLTSSTSAVTTGIVCFVANGASSLLYLNNSASPIASGNAGSNGLGSITILNPAAGGGTGITGKIAKILMYNAAVPSAGVASVFAWCAARYGISAS